MANEIQKVSITREVEVARLKHPDLHGVGYRGVTYNPEEDGSVLVPPEAIDELKSHGFLSVEDADAVIAARAERDEAAEVHKAKARENAAKAAEVNAKKNPAKKPDKE